MNSKQVITKIPFNKPFTTGKECLYVAKAINLYHLSGDGIFTKKCSAWIQQQIGCRKALLTHSGTAALEIAAILADIQPGDEVIMPSFTFVSTANAFVLRGGVPVFVDIRPDTLNMDETQIKKAITRKTKAIVPVHYAGVGCEMDIIMKIAKKYNLLVIEDAAHAILCKYKESSLGSIGHMSVLSFHETKNIHSGEGGALLLNDERFIERAEIVREKGTNRSKFFREEVKKYTWIDVGSSYLPSEINAAFLWAQMREAKSITKNRLRIWRQYHRSFSELESQQKLHRPIIPEYCQHNAHMYYILVSDLNMRAKVLNFLKQQKIHAVFHYIPLHNSPAGLKYGRCSGDLLTTTQMSNRIIRLPMWLGLSNKDIMKIRDTVISAIKVGS